VKLLLFIIISKITVFATEDIKIAGKCLKSHLSKIFNRCTLVWRRSGFVLFYDHAGIMATKTKGVAEGRINSTVLCFIKGEV